MRIQLLLATLLSTTAFAQTPATDRAIRLQGDTCSLHFSVVKYFPMIDAKVNGIKGKLMFDTGDGDGFSFNDHLVAQAGGLETGRGFVGSGQSYAVFRYDTIQQVEIGNQVFINKGPVRGNNMSFLEQVAPDFLGFLGYKFFKDYIFKMDYKKGVITFYKSTPDRQDFLRGEKLIATLDFEIGKLPNHPLVHLKVGGIELLGHFDTGQLGGIYLSDSLQTILIARDVLIPGTQPRVAALRNIEFQNGFTASLDEVNYFPPAQASGFKAAIGIKDEFTLSLGYSFLRQYKTVWDYTKHKLYLLDNY